MYVFLTIKANHSFWTSTIKTSSTILFSQTNTHKGFKQVFFDKKFKFFVQIITFIEEHFVHLVLEFFNQKAIFVPPFTRELLSYSHDFSYLSRFSLSAERFLRVFQGTNKLLVFLQEQIIHRQLLHLRSD